jgi:hypothetical protein
MAGLHAVADCVDRIGRLDRPALPLVVLDDKGEQFETVGLGRACFGSCSKCRSMASSAAS